jgi:hypothetical protein
MFEFLYALIIPSSTEKKYFEYCNMVSDLGSE